MPPRLVSGDVLEVEFPKIPSPKLVFPDGGYGYLVYVGNHASYGGAVRVRPGILYERPTISEELFADSYVTFYPAKPALSQGLVTIVGRLAPVSMPTVLRRGAIKLGSRTLPYMIDVYDKDTKSTTLKHSLTEAEKKINIASIWNHESLLHHISIGWKPEWESDDIPAN